MHGRPRRLAHLSLSKEVIVTASPATKCVVISNALAPASLVLTWSSISVIVVVFAVNVREHRTLVEWLNLADLLLLEDYFILVTWTLGRDVGVVLAQILLLKQVSVYLR